MDPKTVTSLDPKLKEVYDRVMGTANPASSPPPQTTPSNPPHTTSTPPAAASGSLNGILSTSPFPQDIKTSMPSSPDPKVDAIKPPAVPPSPQNPLVSPPTPTAAPMANTPPSMTPPTTPAPSTTPLGRPVIDYAALAAKYATPTPPVSAMASTHQAVVTPSSTTYGVVNNETAKPAPQEKTGSSMKKLLLLVGLPLLLIAYTIIWVVLFKIDIMALLPLPQ